jgi:hypothetical protein
MKDGENVLVFMPKDSGNINIGFLCVRHTVIMGDKPEADFLYWPASETIHRQDVEYTIPELKENDSVPLYDCSSGLYDLYRGNGSHFQIRLVNAGQTQAILRETVSIECPKVRKGIETRFRSGHWEKYLKSEGWVRA